MLAGHILQFFFTKINCRHFQCYASLKIMNLKNINERKSRKERKKKRKSSRKVLEEGVIHIRNIGFILNWIECICVTKTLCIYSCIIRKCRAEIGHKWGCLGFCFDLEKLKTWAALFIGLFSVLRSKIIDEF